MNQAVSKWHVNALSVPHYPERMRVIGDSSVKASRYLICEQNRTVATVYRQSDARTIKSLPELLAICRRVASLNPDAGEIGAGMLRQLVELARAAIEPLDDK